MSAIQTAAANVVFGIADQFRQNCSLKHGLPKVPVLERIGDEPQTTSENVTISRTETTTDATAKESPSPGEGAAADTRSSLLRRAAPFILTAAAGAGVPLLTLLKPQDRNTPPAPVIVQPTEQTKDGSLLQFLQDQGYHLPGGEQWQTQPKQTPN